MRIQISRSRSCCRTIKKTISVYKGSLLWTEEVQAKKRKEEILQELGYLKRGRPAKKGGHNVPIKKEDIANSFGVSERHFKRDIELAKGVREYPELECEKNKIKAYRLLKNMMN